MGAPQTGPPLGSTAPTHGHPPWRVTSWQLSKSPSLTRQRFAQHIYPQDAPDPADRSVCPLGLAQASLSPEGNAEPPLLLTAA